MEEFDQNYKKTNPSKLRKTSPRWSTVDLWPITRYLVHSITLLFDIFRLFLHLIDRLQHQKSLATYASWSKKIPVSLHGKYAIACSTKVFVIKIMCRALARYHGYCAINWAAQWIMAVIRAIITIIIHIHICTVQYIHRIHIRRWSPARPDAITVHHRHKRHPCRMPPTVGHHRIQWMIFCTRISCSIVYTIRPPYYAVAVQQFYKPYQRQTQPHNIKCRRRPQRLLQQRPPLLPPPSLATPIPYNPISKSHTTRIIICTCKIIAYPCIMDVQIWKLRPIYRTNGWSVTPETEVITSIYQQNKNQQWRNILFNDKVSNRSSANHTLCVIYKGMQRCTSSYTIDHRTLDLCSEFSDQMNKTIIVMNLSWFIRMYTISKYHRFLYNMKQLAMSVDFV